MRIREAQGRLVLSSAMTLIPAVAAAGAVACALAGWRRGDVGLWVGFAFLLAGAIVSCRSDRIEIDPAARRITLARWTLWRRSSQALAFEALTGLRLDRIAHLTTGRWRLILETKAGDVPLVPFYEGPRARWVEIGERIRAVVGLRAPITGPTQ